MREQIVTQKVGNRSGIGKSKSGVGQRPAKRGSNENITARLRSLLTYVPLALRIGVIAIIALIAFVGYRAAASASFFQVRTIETRGASRASVDDIKNVVRRDVSETGVWRAILLSTLASSCTRKSRSSACVFVTSKDINGTRMIPAPLTIMIVCADWNTRFRTEW